ncbi:MAG: GNAT family N-acetyltransferase [Clostridia bacterium]|nr:GNAT family N-acetyltransferase [Clostridia bacterium]
MKSNNLVCRGAELTDRSAVSKYIFLTDEYIYPSIAEGYASQKWQELFTLCYGDEENVFYYKNISVIENSGEILGACCIIDGHKRYRFSVKALEGEGDERIINAENGYFQPLFDEAMETDGKIVVNLCIDKRYHRQGLGKMLLEYCIGTAGDCDIYLDVIKSNIGALSLYKSLGFETVKEYSGFSGSDTELPCLQMVKKKSV